jgi:hypothetical protein
MANRPMTSGAILGLLAIVLATSAACGSKKRDENASQDPSSNAFANVPLPTTPACEDAVAKSSSVGCEYLAIHMDASAAADNGCFVSFIANTQEAAVHVGVTFAGAPLDLATYAKIPRGSGPKLKYDDFDPVAGIAPGEVAILFLAGLPEPGHPVGADKDMSAPVPCPVKPALSSLTQIHGTGRGQAFRITTDLPVVAYQMLPYGGGSAAVTGATLLLPTSVWGTNYLAVNAYQSGSLGGNGASSMNIVATEDDTKVTILPRVAISPGPEIDGAAAGEAVTYTLGANEHIQLTQPAELTGSPIQSDKPISVFAGMPCMNVPSGIPYCDHGEQQIPPVSAMGHEYAAVTYRQRTTRAENPPWRIVGAVDGTTLSFDPPVGGPATLKKGQVVEFETGTPFTVKSQDADHPFLLLSYMTGATGVDDGEHPGYGDSDFVRSVPVAQYMDRYVFFTDPTYPETNLVVVRRQKDGAWHDVTLDCAGVIGGWQSLGSGLEYTRVDLSRHDFEAQGACDNGRREMKSDAPFGLWVWGWGSPETSTFTGYVSYGYPAGQNVASLTSVVVPATR